MSVPILNLRSKARALAGRRLGSLSRIQRSDRNRIAVGCGAMAFGTIDLVWLDVGQNGAAHTWIAQAALVAACLILMRRSGVTLIGIAVMSALQVVTAVDAGTETPLSLACAMGVYLFARHNTRGEAIVAGMCAAAAAVASVVIVNPASVEVEAGLEVLQATFFTGIGVAMRSNAERNERLIEVEATKIAQAERLRLARDVHDVVAQNLSSIAVQSGVASRLIDEDPEHAKAALEHINEAGRTSLDELRSFLGLLRSEDYLVERPQKPIRPADIGLLVEEMSIAGLQVDLRATGDFPEAADHATVATTFYIIQESLLNVARHAGPVETTIELVHHEDVVDLRVQNEAARTNRVAVPSTGVGILGMIERAESIGGTLTAAIPAEGGFEVVASLPYRLTSDA